MEPTVFVPTWLDVSATAVGGVGGAAAAAEAADLVVLHYDHDFELIAGVTGQRAEWIVPAGTVA